MKRFLTFKSCLLTFFAGVLVIGLAIEAYGQVGPSWAVWLGVMMLSALLVVVGLSIIVAITIHPSFVIQLRPMGSEWGNVKRGELVFWYFAAPCMMLVGVLGFLDSLLGLLGHDVVH